MTEASPNLGARTTVILVGVVLLCVCGSVGAAVWVYDRLQERAGVPASPPVVNVAEQGLLITAVAPDSPAAAAGLRRGDIILRVGDTAVNTPRDLQQIVRAADGEDMLELAVQRGDNTISLSVIVAGSMPRLGVSVLAPGAAGVAPEATEAGVEISRVLPDTPAAVAGLQQGDQITAVNDQVMERGEELETAVTSRQPGDTLRLTWRRDGQSFSADVVLAPHPDDPERPYLGIEIAPETAP